MVKNSAKNPDQRPVVLEQVAALRAYTGACRTDGQKIALVPTMGALHEGHLELVRQGLAQADKVIVSIFVNPAQFGPNEDFTAYPRTWEADLEKLADSGAHGVFFPAAAEMYPQGFATTVSVSGVSAPLEGAHRTGHFDGVATVVAKLLLQCLPDIALFGEKDWQQLQVIRRMSADLNIPVMVIGVPVVRDENGLALSSRNAYLTPEQREVANSLNRTLFAMAEKIRNGADIGETEDWGRQTLEQAGFDGIDYIDVRDAESLQAPCGRDLRILAAVRLGKARLIDNVAV